jgi:hypothetical protein
VTNALDRHVLAGPNTAMSQRAIPSGYGASCRMGALAYDRLGRCAPRPQDVVAGVRPRYETGVS